MYYARDLDRAILPADPTGAVGAVGRSYRELGWYVAVMQDLGAHATVGARYDYYNPDRDASDSPARDGGPQQRQLLDAEPGRARCGRRRAVSSSSTTSIATTSVGRAAGVPTNLMDNAFSIRGEARF